METEPYLDALRGEISRNNCYAAEYDYPGLETSIFVYSSDDVPLARIYREEADQGFEIELTDSASDMGMADDVSRAHRRAVSLLAF